MTRLLLVLLCFLATTYTSVLGDTVNIGVCYGFNGDNLPTPDDAVDTFKKYGIGKVRIFEPNIAMIEALCNNEMDLVLGVKNQDIPTLAASQEAAGQWFATNVQPYIYDLNIIYITVGNEVVPGQFSDGIVPAMQNLQNIINSQGLAGMKATTVVNMEVLTQTYPPSAATFSDAAMPYMTNIVKYLKQAGAPLLINVYPYFAYASNPNDIRLDYAQFTATAPVVQDGNLSYTNLFDAMVDCFIWAMEKIGVTDLEIAVSESGWPHDGNGEFTTVELAKSYNQNFMNHLLNQTGTPKRPGVHIDGFIFSMIDEDLKTAGVEQKFGMFSPNLQLNYNIFS